MYFSRPSQLDLDQKSADWNLSPRDSVLSSVSFMETDPSECDVGEKWLVPRNFARKLDHLEFCRISNTGCSIVSIPPSPTLSTKLTYPKVTSTWRSTCACRRPQFLISYGWRHLRQFCTRYLFLLAHKHVYTPTCFLMHSPDIVLLHFSRDLLRWKFFSDNLTMVSLLLWKTYIMTWN